MITLRKLREALAHYDCGERSPELENLLFTAVKQTLTEKSSWDIEELEDADEAARYLHVRIQHDHFRS